MITMTPELLVGHSSLQGQIDEQTLLNLAAAVLAQNPQASADDFDYYFCQMIGDR